MFKINHNFSYFIFLYLLVFYFSSFSQNTISNNKLSPDTLTNDTLVKINYEQLIDSIIFYAEKYLGTRYMAGGYSEFGFDCSGFVSYVFARFNINLPRSSRDQALKGMPLKPEEIKRGDLVFFKGRNINSTVVGHVGLVVERTDSTVRFIHASRKKGICYDYTSSDYYKARYIGAKRLLGENIKDSLWIAPQLAAVNETKDTLDNTEDSLSVTKKVDNNTSMYYVVRKGDTLYSIAKRHKTTVEKIQTLNNLKGDKIYPGQKLKIKS